MSSSPRQKCGADFARRVSGAATTLARPEAMLEQNKRGSLLDNGENAQSSSNKKPRPQASPTGVIKHEQLAGEGRREEEALEEGEAGHGVLCGPLPVIADAPQLNNLRMGLELFHCQACLLPLKPPTFKCEDGHVVCATCRVSHGQACASASTYNPSAEVDAFVRDAKLPCAFQGHGCYVVSYQASDHKRTCPWAPCYCPVSGCQFFTSPPRLAEHFRTAHTSWPISRVSYGKPYKIPVPRPATQAQVPATTTALVSVVCARANGDAALGVAQFKCTLWADAQRGSGTVAMLTFPVGSSDLSGGFSPEEQGLFLAVTPKMHDASGEGAGLVVRIDRAASSSG
nr:unnamed protein product [Digitaria exilis]